jgi:hypothetical protein
VSTALHGTQGSRNAIYTLIGGYPRQPGFIQPGEYQLDIDARTFYSSGLELRSNPLNDPHLRYTYHFEVQPVPKPTLGFLVGAVA